MVKKEWRKESHFPSSHRAVFALLGSSPNRSAVTGKGQIAWADQTFVDGQVQKLLLIKAEDKEGKRILWF